VTFGADGKPRELVQSGDNRVLTAEERKLVTDHLRLVRNLAVKRAGKINNLVGGTILDHVLLADLDRIGLQVLEEQVQRWDRTCGVTFGAFVKPRLAGAMDNYITRERIKTASSHAEAKERWKWESHGRRTKENRTSTGAKKAKSYAETSSKRHRTWLIPANPDSSGTELALAQLTPNQRTVYEGRVLADPQVSHAELAAKLNVTRPRVVALEERARQRMAELLNNGNKVGVNTV
jgi:DNA-directed RNA polymerase specialized sigma subunit